MPLAEWNAFSSHPRSFLTNLAMDFHCSPNLLVMCGQLLGQEPVA